MRRDRVFVAGVALFGAAVVAYGLVAVLGLVHWTGMIDLEVYRWGGDHARHGTDLYEAYFHGFLQFTYTPFAALLFVPVASVPLGLAKAGITAATVAALLGTIWITLGALGEERGPRRTGLTLLVAAVSLWLEPVRQTISFGQVNVVLMFLVVLDVLAPPRRRAQGVGVGLAAGFKLTPAIFIPYLLLTRRVRAAAVATGTFVATVGVGALLLPHESHRYWVDRLFSDAKRVGGAGYVSNQSINGVLVRLRGSVDLAHAPWIVLAGLVGVAGLASAAWFGRHGREVEGVLVAALTGLLVSPISWSHHWVYVAPLLALLAHRVLVDRSRVAATLAGVAIALTLGAIWLVPKEHDREMHWKGVELLVGNLYVVAGVAAIAAVSWYVVSAARAVPPRPTGAGAAPAARALDPVAGSRER